MTCHDVRELFSALVDEALDAAQRGALDAHLATCADCRRELAAFKDTVALLHAVAPARAPAGFVDRVLEAAHPAPWHRRLLRALFLPWPVKLPLEAAAVVLVSVSAVYLFRATPELQQAVRIEPPPPAVTEAPRSALTEPAGAGQAATQKLAPAPPSSMQRAPAPPPGTKGKPAPAAREQADERAANLKDASRDIAKRQEEDKPTGRVLEVTRESARPEAPAAESRADALKARRAAPVTPGVASALAPAPADVSGRLSVTDRDAAVRALAELVARSRGVETARRATQEAIMLELLIPREAWAEFARELARLGRWQPDREPGELPATIHLALRITG